MSNSSFLTSITCSLTPRMFTLIDSVAMASKQLFTMRSGHFHVTFYLRSFVRLLRNIVICKSCTQEPTTMLMLRATSKLFFAAPAATSEAAKAGANRSCKVYTFTHHCRWLSKTWCTTSSALTPSLPQNGARIDETLELVPFFQQKLWYSRWILSNETRI